ncbi:MAG: hypothetical protein KG029_03390 [Bacteroidetes bacterium]|jgi:hypothetical protein|nr:hypothetical protein [Bacteroidota bacterium]
MKTNHRLFATILVLFLTALACSLPGQDTQPPTVIIETPQIEPAPLNPTAVPAATEDLAPVHQIIPAAAPLAKPYPDVTSNGTASEKRAPFGDSYNINRLERPFMQDMTYQPDLDIAGFSISQDSEWYFVSIALVGRNPNNDLGIHYSVELDTNIDSFGDYLIVASPPYSEEWSADNIRIYKDTNRNTAGLSASRSDAPFTGDGFDSLIHDPAGGVILDPDVAWVRINADNLAMVQFAFKKSWAGNQFLYSVMADAGPRDPSLLDYVDHWTFQDAGSPVRNEAFYPLGELFLVDNTCYQAIGFTPTGFEPKICPEIVQPQITTPNDPSTPPPTEVDYCTSIGSPNPGNCPYGWSDAPYCYCTPG